MLDFKKTEADVLKFWEKNKTYQKLKERNEKGEKFYFLQGPPYTSGKLHIGHAWNNSLKDMIIRYKRMRGYNVWDRGGYDMHGLPTEHAVQKKLKLKTKDEILNYGMDKFVEECMNFSVEHAGYMNDDLWNIGIWMDHKNAYKPIEKSFIDGQWSFFHKAWKDGRLYKGLKSMHWDAETETSLAKHELEYKNVVDESVFLKFKKKDSENEYFVIWTTTPWTIPFNLAIMVNPDFKYVKVKVGDEYWIVAKDLAGVFISGLLGKNVEIVEEFKGSELEGQEYVQPFYEDVKEVYDGIKAKCKNAFTIILSSEYVDTSAGTGLVHCAPGCGPEDFEVGAKYGIEPFNTLNERGEFENLGKFTGWVAKTDDEKFIKEFEKKGILIAKSEVEHEYPHSDRSKKPVVFRTVEQWFLKISDLVPKLIQMNKDVKWVPKRAGESHERWISNLRDNSITRQRFWGCPIPLWVNVQDENDYFVLSGVDELEKLTGKKFDDLHLHRPWIDEIVIEKKGKKYKRIPDVSDVWIDSGTASWNCLYNDPKLIREWFPAELVLEGTEHTRLWFSMLQICSAIMYGKTSFKNAFAHGMLLDFQGTKMSKSLGNVISPYEVIDKYSVDIFRNYICQTTAGENINFSWEDVKVKQRNLTILSNVANYILDLERQNPKGGDQGIEEKWIASVFNSALKKTTKLFEEYRLDETIGAIENLYITLSRDYIKYVREKASENKEVLNTVKNIYLDILRMFSPVCPFVTESLWQKMGQDEESVHFCEWPKYDVKKIDVELEKEFETAMKVIESGLAMRDRKGVGLRWPLSKATVQCDVVLREEVLDLIARQLNVKKVEMRGKGNIEVELDFELSEELEAEGFARELARRIQAERKKMGLQKGDVVNLKIGTDDGGRGILEKNLNFLKDRVNATKIEFVDDKNLKGGIKFEIKDREFCVFVS